MKLTNGWVAGTNKSYKVSGSGVAPEGEFKWKQEKEAISSKEVKDELKMSIMIAALCNNSVVQPGEDEGTWERIGDPTEIALTLAAMKLGLGKKEWTKKFKFVGEIAFDSNRKRMSVIYKQNKGSDHYILVKGTKKTFGLWVRFGLTCLLYIRWP